MCKDYAAAPQESFPLADHPSGSVPKISSQSPIPANSAI